MKLFHKASNVQIEKLFAKNATIGRWLAGKELPEDWDFGLTMLEACFYFIPLTPIRYLFNLDAE